MPAESNHEPPVERQPMPAEPNHDLPEEPPSVEDIPDEVESPETVFDIPIPETSRPEINPNLTNVYTRARGRPTKEVSAGLNRERVRVEAERRAANPPTHGMSTRSHV